MLFHPLTLEQSFDLDRFFSKSTSKHSLTKKLKQTKFSHLSKTLCMLLGIICPFYEEVQEKEIGARKLVKHSWNTSFYQQIYPFQNKQMEKCLFRCSQDNALHSEVHSIYRRAP